MAASMFFPLSLSIDAELPRGTWPGVAGPTFVLAPPHSLEEFLEAVRIEFTLPQADDHFYDDTQWVGRR